MRVLFLVPLLGLTLGPRTVVSNTITSYTVAEVEEDTGATDAGNGDIGVWPDSSDVVDEAGRPLVHSDAYAVGKGIQALFRYCIEAITGAAPEAGTDADGVRSWRCLLHRSRPEPRTLRAPSLGNNP